MDRAILGLCADKLLIYVTHDLEQASQMDKVIFLKGSKEAPQVLSQQEYLDNLEELRGKLKNPFSIQNGPADAYNSEDSTAASENEGQQVI